MKKGVSSGKSRKHYKSKKEFNNRLMYSLIAFGILLTISIGVYATTSTIPGASKGATTIPNPGHPVSELQTCGPNQILQTNSSGTGWNCTSVLPSCNSGQILSYGSSGWSCTSVLPSCNSGQILSYGSSGWSCTNMPSFTDTRCDTSGTCSQVCIGTNCQSSWPSSGISGCSISQTTASNGGYTGVGGCTTISVNCPSGYIRTGCSGNWLKASGNVEPSGSNGCAQYICAAGVDNDYADIYAYCTKITCS